MMGDYTEHLISMAGGDGEPDALDLDAIQARAEAATEGPWDFGTGYSADGSRELNEKTEKASFLTLSLNDDGRPLSVIQNGEVIPAVTGDGPKAKANAEFIAAARTDVPALLALVREQQARIDAVSKILDEKYKLWAAICGNTCSKDIIGVDHDAIADEVAAAIRAALTATEAEA